MTKLEYLFAQLNTSLDWYKSCEEKAKYLVGLNTVIVGGVNSLVFVGAERTHATHAFYADVLVILLALAGIALVGSFVFVLRSLWPRHHARIQGLNIMERLWFFGDIASMTPTEHRAAMDRWTEKDLENTMVVQNYILSTNVWRKHQALNRAIALTIGVLVLLLVIGVVHAVGFETEVTPAPTDRI